MADLLESKSRSCDVTRVDFGWYLLPGISPSNREKSEDADSCYQEPGACSTEPAYVGVVLNRKREFEQ